MRETTRVDAMDAPAISDVDGPELPLTGSAVDVMDLVDVLGTFSDTVETVNKVDDDVDNIVLDVDHVLEVLVEVVVDELVEVVVEELVIVEVVELEIVLVVVELVVALVIVVVSMAQTGISSSRHSGCKRLPSGAHIDRPNSEISHLLSSRRLKKLEGSGPDN